MNGWRLDGSTIVERGRNALYKGMPDGTFKDVTDEAGVGGEGEWGSGAFVADYDGDGWPDIFVTNFGKNVLYRNLGNGRFRNVAADVGLESPGWNTGAAFSDSDGDGDLDVYIASYIDTHARRGPQGETDLELERCRERRVRTVRAQGRTRSFLPERRWPLRGRDNRLGPAG